MLKDLMTWPPSGDSLVILFGILSSIYLWGIVRTALWILPNLFITGGLWISSTALLSFFAVTAWFAPHQKRAFDLRGFSKERWTLTFFVSGLVSGFLMYPTNALLMGLAVIIPLFTVRALILLKLPPSRVLFIHANTRILFTLIVLGIGAYRLWEIYKP